MSTSTHGFDFVIVYTTQSVRDSIMSSNAQFRRPEVWQSSVVGSYSPLDQSCVAVMRIAGGHANTSSSSEYGEVTRMRADHANNGHANASHRIPDRPETESHPLLHRTNDHAISRAVLSRRRPAELWVS